MSQVIVNKMSNDWSDMEILEVEDDYEQEVIAGTLNPVSNGASTGDASLRPYLEVLHRNFGHKDFRPMQWQIIKAVLIDRRDVCAVMATGYGKSLCFQFPSVFTGGVTIVISPLISLMEDQILSLTMSSIPACLLGSAQTKSHKTMNEIMDGKYSIVYATPEFCLGDYGSDCLRHVFDSQQVDLIAIDEAHCVSQWGHDFRYQYRHLAKLRKLLPNVPMLAVTATATKSVQNDIVESLQLRNPVTVNTGFDRPNLFFEVHTKDPILFNDLNKFIVTDESGPHFDGATIIYCIKRADTETISAHLTGRGIECAVYHAGMPLSERKRSHERFQKDKVRVIAATIAFGMGIDKADVRNIIHYGASKDIESYYQEVGRAGRDGQPARCVTFYKHSDFNIHSNLLEGNVTSAKVKEHKYKLAQTMQKYLDTSECRRQFVLSYFDGSTPKSAAKMNCCDNCTKKLLMPNPTDKYQNLDEEGKYNMREEALLFLGLVKSLGGAFGVQMYNMILRGSKSSKVYDRHRSSRFYGLGKEFTEEWLKVIARILEREGYLKKISKTQSKFKYVTTGLSDKGEQLLAALQNDEQKPLKVHVTADMRKHLKLKPVLKPVQNDTWTQSGMTQSGTTTAAPVAQESSENVEDRTHRLNIYKRLMATRNEIGMELNVGMYLVASNAALMQMAKTRPTSIQTLKDTYIDGFNDSKINQFGQQFIDVITSYCSENNLEVEPSVPMKRPALDAFKSTPKRFRFTKPKTPESDTTMQRLSNFCQLAEDQMETETLDDNKENVGNRTAAADDREEIQNILDEMTNIVANVMSIPKEVTIEDDVKDILDDITNVMDDDFDSEFEVDTPEPTVEDSFDSTYTEKSTVKLDVSVDSCESVAAREQRELLKEFDWLDSPEKATDEFDDDFDGDLSQIVDDVEKERSAGKRK